MRSVVARLCALGSLGLLLGGVGAGCDSASPSGPLDPPRVANLQVTPDSVNGADLPPDLVEDSVAFVPLSLSVRATDPDGAVERVVFAFEPATLPQQSVFGELEEREDNRYVLEDVAIGVPADVDEVYSVRVFAVDTDSLASNEAVGRFRFVP